MKIGGLLSEILNAVVSHERDKARKETDLLSQKKQLWYRLMNQIDGDAKDEEKSSQS